MRSQKMIGVTFFFFVSTLFSLSAQPVFLNDGTVEVSVSLHLQMNWGFMGIPSDVKDQGVNFFLDLDTNRTWTKEYQNLPLPQTEKKEGWDIAFTYTLKEVSMGPMGKHFLPFLDAIVNDSDGASYYMVETDFSNLKEVDPTLFREKGWKGYSFREFKDNRKIFKEKYRNSFPFFCFDWYEVSSMRKFDYQAYAGRVFVIRTTENQFYKIQFVEVKGIGKEGIFEIKFFYQPISF